MAEDDDDEDDDDDDDEEGEVGEDQGGAASGAGGDRGPTEAAPAADAGTSPASSDSALEELPPHVRTMTVKVRTGSHWGGRAPHARRAVPSDPLVYRTPIC